MGLPRVLTASLLVLPLLVAGCIDDDESGFGEDDSIYIKLIDFEITESIREYGMYVEVEITNNCSKSIEIWPSDLVLITWTGLVIPFISMFNKTSFAQGTELMTGECKIFGFGVAKADYIDIPKSIRMNKSEWDHGTPFMIPSNEIAIPPEVAFGRYISFTPGNRPTCQETVIGNPKSISVKDIDGDGSAEIAVAFFNKMGMMFQTGGSSRSIGQSENIGCYKWDSQAGGLDEIWRGSSGDSPIRVLLHDIVGDDNLDLISVNWNSYDAWIFEGYGNGSFSDGPIQILSCGVQPFDLAVDHFDSDGYIDIAVINGHSMTGDGFEDSVRIFRGSENGTFVLDPNVLIDGVDGRIDSGDLNGDDRADIVVNNRVFIQNPSGALISGPTFDSKGFPLIEDIDCNGLEDLLIGNRTFMNTANVLSNDLFAEFQHEMEFSTGGIIDLFHDSSDVNDDGLCDLILGPKIYIQNHDRSFSKDSSMSLFVGVYPFTYYGVVECIDHGDLNGDGHDDIVILTDEDCIQIYIRSPDSDGDGYIDEYDAYLD
ncbi:MAG: FG-GAP repeat domain-containing protein [Thermoplasmatota archaeon]